MYKDEIAKQCESMSDEELLAALTVDKQEYSADFHKAAEIELRNRNVQLSKIKNTVRVKINDQNEETVTIEMALAKLNQDISLFDVLSFTNCLNETLIFQKESHCWVGHYLYKNKYEASFFIESPQTPEEILSLFLNLQDWNAKVEKEFQLLDLVVLVSSDSDDYIESVSNLLAKLKIPSIVKNVNLTRIHLRPSWPQIYDENSTKILVPRDYLGSAQKALTEMEHRIDNLHKQASELAQSGDIQRELSILSQLAKLVPNDETVLFNRGVILFELGRYKEAADSFIASLANNHNYVELFEDSIQYLKQIAEKLPEDVGILHNLATFSKSKGEDNKTVEQYYRKILLIKPTDALAHLNLGYLYYEQDDDISAYHHFMEYLELEPESDERARIESIIKQIR